MLSARFALPAPLHSALVLALALCAASCSPTVPIGENDPDGSTLDADGATPDTCAACPPAWVEGHTRVATTVDGQVVELDVYLPDGIDDGAHVLVRDPAFRRFSMTRPGTLADGAADFELYGDLRLELADPCLTMTFGSYQLIPRPGTDVGLRTAPVERYCPVVSDPPTTVTVRAALSPSALGGLSYLTVSGTPIDPSSFVGAIAHVDGVDVPLVFGGDEIGGTLTLATAAEPNQVVTIDLPGIQTLDGSSADATVQLLQTSAVVSDLDFTGAPPEGAVAWIGYAPTYVDGTLRVEDEGYGERASPLGLLIALGDVGAATEIRVEGTSPSRVAGPSQLVVYRERGLRSPASYYRGDEIIDIPAGTGAVWLAIAHDQMLPSPGDATGPLVFTIDSITLLD